MSKKFFLAALAVAASLQSAVAGDDIKSYLPDFHGVLRPQYSLSTTDGESLFRVRNARLALSGHVTDDFDYFAQVDLCQEGSFKALDFWGRLAITKEFKVQAGQFRMPFGVEPFRAPGNYIFTDRSFLGKQMCNYRAIGAKAMYTFAKLPVSIEGGVFSPYAITIQNRWTKKLAYSCKASVHAGDFTFTTGFMSIIPDGVRTNLVDGAISWSAHRWLVEAEYMYEHYTHKAHKACNGFATFVDYWMPLKAGKFNRLSFQGRFDMMGDHSTAICTEDAILVTDNPARRRITVGSTISHITTKRLHFDLRMNYLKYFYDKGVTVPAAQNDQLVAEVVVQF
ncbi:MAG: OprO/OprP family phosphate-selective porin [Muribaculaceae bacterium]|nr:OprO/OprP family phosphate-selective porin [Muribaculaceae bacterium]